jgi:hypothetical protein
MSDLSPDGRWLTTSVPLDRERVVRTLTFWLRPAFVLRVSYGADGAADDSPARSRPGRDRGC